MLLTEFLQLHGLTNDPFAQTNAEEEEMLAEYFVPPPYFSAVRGDPGQPKSTIVFAPRGGGKTAQRRMLEEDSRQADSAYLCVLYDRFDGHIVERPTIAQHIDELCLRVMLGVLVRLEELDVSSGLPAEDREFLTNEAALLDAVSEDRFHDLLRSLKSDPRKLGDWIRSHSGPVKVIVAGLLGKRGLQLDPTLPWGPQMTKAKETPPLSRLRRLIALANTVGYDSVYILVDRLDETASTTVNPDRAIDLVADLLLDLTVMELKGLAVKVFAWDLSRDHYHELGGRQDRIKEFQLVWELDAVAAMMSRRLKAFSGGQVVSLNQLLGPYPVVDLHQLACFVAHGSPRDMIRFCGRVVAEHLNRTPATHLVSEDAIWAGVTTFSAEICEERVRRFLPDLLRLDKYRFTQNKVANDYLKISKQAVGAKVAEWRRTGMIAKVAEVQDARARPQHLYGVADPRLAVHLRPGEQPGDVLEYFAFQCIHCASINLSDDTNFTCIGCKRELDAATTPSLMSLCAPRPPLP